MMFVDSSISKKSSKNKKNRKSSRVEGVVAKKKAKETASKGICFYYGQDGHWRGTTRPIWSLGRRWHVMFIYFKYLCH